jgi:stage II sporulation SpoE-like protein
VPVTLTGQRTLPIRPSSLLRALTWPFRVQKHVLISWQQPHQVAGEDTALLGTIGLVLAHALERAATYEQTRRRADRLEAELLPGQPPALVGVEAAATYRTASGQRVAGHWYDTIALPGGRTLLAVGDVHNDDAADSLEGAISMGILRHAVLTYAEQDLPLDEILARLTDSALRLSQRGPAVTASCLLVEYDATTGRCAVASAGHAPPILLQPGAGPASLGVPVGERIGLAQLPAEVVETRLPDGAVLVLSTAGLLGHSGSESGSDTGPLIEAIHRHSTAAPLPADGGGTLWLAALIESVTGVLLGKRPADVAMLAVSTRRVPHRHMAAWELPRTAQSAAAARNAVAHTLAGWGLQEVTESAELIVSGLVGNTVRYARGIDDAGSGQDGEVIRLRLLNLARILGRARRVMCRPWSPACIPPWNRTGNRSRLGG